MHNIRAVDLWQGEKICLIQLKVKSNITKTNSAEIKFNIKL